MKNFKRIRPYAIMALISLGAIPLSETARANIWNSGDALGSTYGGIVDLTTGASFMPASLNTTLTAITDINASTILVGDPGGRIFEVTQSGNVSLLATFSFGRIYSLATDASGNIFAGSGNISNSQWVTSVAEYSPTGTLLATFGGIGDVAAVSANGQNLYGIVGNTPGITNYNVATGTSTIIPGITSTVDTSGISVLPNGNILAASNSTSTVYEINPTTGAVVSQSTATVPNAWESLAVNLAGTSFYAAASSGGGAINEYTLAGAPVASFATNTFFDATVVASEPGSGVLLMGMLGMLGVLMTTRSLRGRRSAV